MTAIEKAAAAVQEMRDQQRHDQLMTYVFDWMGESLDVENVSTEELERLHVSDNWACYQGYDRAEFWESCEGALAAYDRVLVVLKGLSWEARAQTNKEERQ